MTFRHVIGLAAALLSGLMLPACGTAPPRVAPGVSPSGAAGVGLRAPDFSLPASDGGQVSLSSLRSRGIMLEFLATW